MLTKRYFASSRVCRSYFAQIGSYTHTISGGWPTRRSPGCSGSASSPLHTSPSPMSSILVDWGTSSFRAFLLDAEGKIVDTTSSDKGGILNVTNFDVAFEAQCGEWPTSAPVYICGMAGSNRGWKEVPYAKVPATMSDLTSRAKKFVSETGRQIVILPGLSCAIPRGEIDTYGDAIAPDVMRGEETQIFGALSLLGDRKPSVLVLPGTHSKWAQLDPTLGQVNYFKTFMTGEVFSLASKHSILKTAPGVDEVFDPAQFVNGVQIAKRSEVGLLSDLFEVRRRLLAKRVEPSATTSLLSGIVIGHEVAAAVKYFGLNQNTQAGIVGSKSLLKLYSEALAQWKITPELVNGEEASIRGLLAVAGQLPANSSEVSERPDEAGRHPECPSTLLQDQLRRCPMIAILRGVKPAEVLAIGAALKSAGFSIVEVPWNSPNCTQSIKMLSEAFGSNMLVGGGTIDTVQKVHAVADAGGKVIVSPNFDPEVVQAAVQRNLVALPGVMTPTEAFAALKCGAHGLKLFPSDIIGTAGFKAFKTVLPRDTIMLPVGGVDVGTLPSFWAAGARGFGIGSSLYKPGMTADEVAERAQELIRAFAPLRDN